MAARNTLRSWIIEADVPISRGGNQRTIQEGSRDAEKRLVADNFRFETTKLGIPHFDGMIPRGSDNFVVFSPDDRRDGLLVPGQRH